MRGRREWDDSCGDFKREGGALRGGVGAQRCAVGGCGCGLELVEYIGVVAHGAFFAGEHALEGRVASAGADFDGVLSAALA